MPVFIGHSRNRLKESTLSAISSVFLRNNSSLRIYPTNRPEFLLAWNFKSPAAALSPAASPFQCPTRIRAVLFRDPLTFRPNSIAIVTGFDTAEHFRKQFEDLMLVQDIESVVKEHVQFAFGRLALTEDDINAAIRRVGDHEDRVRTKIREAIKLYAEKAGQGVVDEEAVASATLTVSSKAKAVTFDRLTLAHYSGLLLSDQCWAVLQTLYSGMPQGALRKLLNSVQKHAMR